MRCRLEFGADVGQFPLVPGAYHLDETGAVPAPALGLIQGLVDQADRAIERDIGCRALHRKARVTDGDRATDHLPIPRHGLAAHRLQQPCRRDVRLGGRHRPENGQEFLAAPTNELVIFTQCRREALTHRSQHRVARRMAVGIVDAFEMVEVRQQHAAPDRAPAVDREHPLVEVTPIRQSRQRIMFAAEAQPIVGPALPSHRPNERGADERDDQRTRKGQLLAQALFVHFGDLERVVSPQELELACLALIVELRGELRGTRAAACSS